MKLIDQIAQRLNKKITKYNWGLYRRQYVERLELSKRRSNVFLNLKENQKKIINKYYLDSRTQIYQDLFVLTELGDVQDGYFVEFGATNGSEGSNTYLFEKMLGWNGILAEPAKVWHKELFKSRECNIETSCVWVDSNSSFNFFESDIPTLSTLSEFRESDHYKRVEGNQYKVQTISLIDMLVKYNAPSEIDYLSIDTEGSEYEILNSFDFNRYKINIITVEHNWTSNRDKIFDLLVSKGYKRVYESISLFDDWYILKK